MAGAGGLPWQALVIGGGPAGATCAAALARRGVAVGVLESRAFPRVKVCGEFLSPAVAGLLPDYVSESALRSAGAQAVTRLEVFASGSAVARWAMPRPAWSLSRSALDELLLNEARRCGAQVMQPMAVRHVEYDQRGVTVHTDGQTLRAGCVIHADGSGRHDPAGPVPHRAGVLALKCHLRWPGTLGGALHLHGFGTRRGRGYFGLVGVEAGLATLAMVVDASLVKEFAGDHDALLAHVWAGAPVTGRACDWLTCPVPASGYIAPAPASYGRSFRIGNAAAAVEPVGGEGIGLAIWSGDLLGRTLEVSTPRVTQGAFAAAYRRRLRVRRPACRAIAAALSRPRMLRALAPVLAIRPALALGALYRLTGKA